MESENLIQEVMIVSSATLGSLGRQDMVEMFIDRSLCDSFEEKNIKSLHFHLGEKPVPHCPCLSLHPKS